MLLARYAPFDSNRYERLSQKSAKFDKLIEWFPSRLFGLWAIFVAGMSVGKAQLDRYYFWDWNDWIIGIICIVLITVLLKLISSRFGYFNYTSNKISFSQRSIYYIMPLALLYSGSIITAGLNTFYDVAIYLLPCISIFLINSIKINSNTNSISKESFKYLKTLISITLLFISVIIGFIFDDPLIATASVVTLPFWVVLLFGNHGRHLERAKFYPIFIFTMFVCSREAWLIIPVYLLFFILRSYNYLRHQKVYPTFGVSDDSN